MKLPSDKYFFWVDSEETFNNFKATGMMYELEVFAPDTWQDHLEMLQYKKKKEYYDSVKVDNYEASSRLENKGEEE